MTLAANKELVKRYLNAWNDGDVASLQTLIAPDFIDHAHPDWQPGADALQDNMRMFGAAFSDIEYLAESMIAEGDFVAFRATIHARHTGQFGTFAPTGNTVTYHALEMIRIADGRSAEIWSVADTLDWVQQLGATITFSAAAD